MPSKFEQNANKEKDAGIVPSHGISVDLPGTTRPTNIRHVYVRSDWDGSPQTDASRIDLLQLMKAL